MKVSREMTADSIRYHLKTLERGVLGPNGRLLLWRLIIRTAQDEYDRELSELESLNFPMVEDPSLTGVPVL